MQVAAQDEVLGELCQKEKFVRRDDRNFGSWFLSGARSAPGSEPSIVPSGTGRFLNATQHFGGLWASYHGSLRD